MKFGCLQKEEVMVERRGQGESVARQKQILMESTRARTVTTGEKSMTSTELEIESRRTLLIGHRVSASMQR